MYDSSPYPGVNNTHMDIRTQADLTTARQNKNITSLTFHQGVTIVPNAFKDCTGLTSIVIHLKVTIKVAAFLNCTGLTSIVIPHGVTIGLLAFKGCTGLTSIVIHRMVTIGVRAFEGCTGLTSIVIGQEAVIKFQAFSGCRDLTSIVILPRVTIGGQAFLNCTGVTSIVIPHGVTIGELAFASCTNQTSVFVMCSDESGRAAWTQQNQAFLSRPYISFHFIHERAIMEIVKKVAVHLPGQLLEIPIYPDSFNQTAVEAAKHISTLNFINTYKIRNQQYTNVAPRKLCLSVQQEDLLRQQFRTLFMIEARRSPNNGLPPELWLKLFSYLFYARWNLDGFDEAVRTLYPGHRPQEISSGPIDK